MATPSNVITAKLYEDAAARLDAAEGLRAALVDLAQRVSTVKGMLPLDHPAQNYLAYDLDAALAATGE